MMGWHVVICKIIRQVGCFFLSIYDEISLANVVVYPVKSHAGGLGASLFRVIGGDFSGVYVFHLHGRW